jgi:hypothetical protein
MNDISKSPQRHTFQMERYIERCKEEDKEPSQDYLDMFLETQKNHNNKFTESESTKDNMEYDLLTTDWILEKVRNSEAYAQNLYACMCNNEFVKNDVWPRLTDKRWGCSWRSAGGIIADMREEGDYIDWYCSGIRGDKLTDDEFKVLTNEQQEAYLKSKSHVGEGHVTDEIREDLLRLGWIVIDEGNERIY